MKKIIICAVILMLSVFLVACGDSSDTNPQDENTPVADTSSQANEDVADDAIDEAEDNDGQAEDTNSDNDNDTNESDTLAAAPTGFAFEYRGTLIEMDRDMEELLPQLGEPLGIFEAPSCAFDGIDRIFGYRGIQIHTYPDGDIDRIHTVSFMDDSVTTMSGIRLGDSIADALGAYGNNYTQDTGMFIFTIDRTTLSFFVEDDEISSIIFGLIMD